MRKNHEITVPKPLLDSRGHLAEPGWARQLLLRYDRNAIKAPKWRIKEWDYYIVMNDDHGCAFTFSDLAYMGLLSVTLFNFRERWQHTTDILTAMPMGRFGLSNTSQQGDARYKDDRLELRYEVTPGKRRIYCDFKDFWEGKPLTCDISLDQPPMDSMVIATPWKEKKTAFYYNQKINCMPATGSACFDGVTYEFTPERSFGTLDWGRGVWTYDNRWYWGSGNGVINGKRFGFNIGYGFGDTSAATENMLFYDGKCHKLEDVSFNIPESGYLDKWTFTSSDGRFEMEFEPILERAGLTDLKLLVSDQHQVFGRMTGRCILDDGTVLELKDFLCFAEDVHNKY